MWDAEAENRPTAAGAVFQTAAALAANAAAAAAEPALAFGGPLDLADFAAAAAEITQSGTSGKVPSAPKKAHAHAGPQLLALLGRLQEEEAAREVAAARSRPQPAAEAAPKRPTVPVASGVPIKVILAAKRTVPLGGAAPKQPAAKKKKPPAAAAAAAGSGAGAEPAKPKPKPKPKPAEVDVAELKIPELAAAGSLGSLTIPQLKAFCRSVKLPVGGKKTELEERIMGHLGLRLAAAEP